MSEDIYSWTRCSWPKGYIEGKLIMRTDKSRMDIHELFPGIYMVIFKDSYGESVQQLKVVKE